MPKQFISSAGVSAMSEPKLAAPGKLGAFLGKATEWIVLVAAAVIRYSFCHLQARPWNFPNRSRSLCFAPGRALLDRINSC